MKKGLFILMALVLAISVGLIGCPKEEPKAPESIIIGFVRDIDEDLAFFDWCAGGPVVRWFVDEINDAGGIYLDKYDAKVPIELDKRDFSLADWDIAAITRDVIDDGCHFVWGGPGTACIYAQAPVCNSQGVLLLTLEGGASYMIWEKEEYLDNWPWVFINLNFSSWYQLRVLYEILYEELGRAPKLYITYIDDDHGVEYLTESRNVFGVGNIVASVAHDFSIDISTANTIIGTAKDALGTTPYDLFCGWTYPWNVEMLTQAAINLNFNPPGIIFGPGANFGYYAWSFDDEEQGLEKDPRLVDGIMCFATATPKTEVSVGTPTMSMEAMYEILAAQLDEDVENGDCLIPLPGPLLLDYWGHPCYVAALGMWKYAVEEVGDIDGRLVRNTLAGFGPTAPARTVFGNTWYRMFGGGDGGGVLDYKCQTGQIGQWQLAGNVSIVEIIGYAAVKTGTPRTEALPNYDITATTKYPMTDEWYWIKND